SIGKHERKDCNCKPGSEGRANREGNRISNREATLGCISVGFARCYGHIAYAEANREGSCGSIYRAVDSPVPALWTLQQDCEGGRTRQRFASLRSEKKI